MYLCLCKRCVFVGVAESFEGKGNTLKEEWTTREAEKETTERQREGA